MNEFKKKGKLGVSKDTSFIGTSNQAIQIDKNNQFLLVCLMFLITSPISQYLVGLVSKIIGATDISLMGVEAGISSTITMIIVCFFALIGFHGSKNNTQVLISSSIFTLCICSLVLFLSWDYNLFVLFYPDRFVVGTIFSFFILRFVASLSVK